MAIQISYVAPTQVTHPAAYARVEQLEFNLLTKEVTIQVAIYADAAARQAGAMAVRKLSFDLTDEGGATDFTDSFGDVILKPSGKSPLVLAYTWLKNQADFSDGTDV